MVLVQGFKNRYGRKVNKIVNYSEIQQLRKEYGISQTKLAEYSGLSKSKISSFELGKSAPSEKEVSCLKKVLEDLIERIKLGELNLKGHRVVSTVKKEVTSKQQIPIKDREDYKKRTCEMTYNGEYPKELSKLYHKAQENNEKSIKAIGLFSGCGGLDFGFKAAGVNFVGHIEIWDAANRIYSENFPNVKLLKTDINDVTNDDIQNWISEFGTIDIIVGGPPCQGFSLAGKRDSGDLRNQLYKQYVRIVRDIHPKVFVFENVAKLTSMKNKSGELFLNEILQSFADVGYTLKYKILNACNYGVPQSRERVILVGVRTDLNVQFEFPVEKYVKIDDLEQLNLFDVQKPLRTFQDAMEGLESLENGERSKDDPLHWAIVHPEHVINWLKDVPEGKSAHDNDDPQKRPPSGFNTTYKRNTWKEPCSTISTNFNMISGCRNVHPTNTRSLTIREAARAQSFPDEFVFCGKWGDIRAVIGNAVPPLLAHSIAEEIINQVFKGEI